MRCKALKPRQLPRHMHRAVSTHLSCVGGMRAVGGGHLLPSKETDVEDTVRHFHRSPHLQSNVKSLISTSRFPLELLG